MHDMYQRIEPANFLLFPGQPPDAQSNQVLKMVCAKRHLA
jgi:hypothetical protein